jgi:hypothetical protein
VRLAVAWEARRAAREIVKQNLRAEGVKVALLSASTITRRTRNIFALMRPSCSRKRRRPALCNGSGPKLTLQISELMHKRRAIDQTTKLLNEIHVHNGEPK